MTDSAKPECNCRSCVELRNLVAASEKPAKAPKWRGLARADDGPKMYAYPTYRMFSDGQTISYIDQRDE